MQKLKLTLIIALSLVALKFNLFSVVAAFLLVGAIPGTTYSLPAGGMLIIFGVIVWLVFCQKTAAGYVRQFLSRSHKAKQSVNHTIRMPRRRFGQI